MMTTYKPIDKVDLNLPYDIFTDIFPDFAIWWLISAGIIYYLADVLVNNTDLINQFVSIMQETSLETAIDKAKSLDVSLLNTNSLPMTKLDLPINTRFDINSIHLLIFHAKQQLILLATINTNFTLNIHAQAIVNESTSAIELNNIYDRFLDSFGSLVSSRAQPISIQTTIITKANLEFFYKSEPFIPILDILTQYPFHLFAYMYDLPSVNLQLENIGLNIFALEVFESQLIHWNGLLNNLLTIAENTSIERQPLWCYYQAHGQLWRYIVTIRSAYIIPG